MNLVDLIKGQLGGDMISSIAGLLNTTPENASRAVDAGVPTLLAGLTGTASTTEGARTLAHAVNNADEGLMSKLGNMLSGGGSRNLIDTGSGMLSALFGGNTVSGLTGALSKFTGLGSGAIASLLGLLAPVVMSALKGRAASAGGLDARSISNLLAGQKDNISRAMPAGLGGMLSSIPGFSWLSARPAAPAADYEPRYEARREPEYPQRERSYAPQPDTVKIKPAWWLVPLAALLALSGFLYFINRRPAPAPVPVHATPEMRNPAIDLSMDSSSLLSSLTGTVAEWKDAADVNASVPRLRDYTRKLEDLQNSVNNLPASGRDSVTRIFKDGASRVIPRIENALGYPGLSAEATSALTGLLQKFKGIAGV